MHPLDIQSVGCHTSPIVEYFSSNFLQFFISIICGTWWIRRRSLVFVKVIFKCRASALLNFIFSFETHFQWKGRDWACVDNPSEGVGLGLVFSVSIYISCEYMIARATPKLMWSKHPVTFGNVRYTVGNIHQPLNSVGKSWDVWVIESKLYNP